MAPKQRILSGSKIIVTYDPDSKTRKLKHKRDSDEDEKNEEKNDDKNDDNIENVDKIVSKKTENFNVPLANVSGHKVEPEKCKICKL